MPVQLQQLLLARLGKGSEQRGDHLLPRVLHRLQGAPAPQSYDIIIIQGDPHYLLEALHQSHDIIII